MKDPREIIWRPVVTEKSTIERETENIVTFAVDPRANKIEIKSAVEGLFDVKVVDALRIEGRRAPLDAMYDVPFFKQ